MWGFGLSQDGDVPVSIFKCNPASTDDAMWLIAKNGARRLKTVSMQLQHTIRDFELQVFIIEIPRWNLSEIFYG